MGKTDLLWLKELVVGFSNLLEMSDFKTISSLYNTWKEVF